MIRRKNKINIDPDETFLDSRNLSGLDEQQLDGRIEKALSLKSLIYLGTGFTIIFLLFGARVGYLQIARGEEFRSRSQDNSLRLVTIPTERGVIYDRKGELLAWNDPGQGRVYTKRNGFAHLVGYLGLPDENDVLIGDIHDQNIRIGKQGVEKVYEDTLRGKIGEKYQEVDSGGNVTSEVINVSPVDGKPLRLAIDAEVTEILYKAIESVAEERDFTGGAGVIINVKTGEILALTSYPEFPLSLLSGTSTSSGIGDYLIDPRTPFVNRAVSGLYAPGSIVKPFMAIAALSEKVISPEKQILSTGKLEVPNPYSPGKVTVFKDWKAHGWVDMREALAVSSNVYFYEIGGGFEGQKGLGIANIDKYSELFGLGKETGVDLPGELSGNVPSPQWKKENFHGEAWVLGDTYHTSIGQYGFQVTPVQMARAVAALANKGKMLTPSVVEVDPASPKKAYDLSLPPEYFKVIKDGMRQAVLEGTAVALNVPYEDFAGKTGTAELGETKARVNSWIEGYFPLNDPEYAFAIVMEKGHVGNTIGAAAVARNLFDQMAVYTPDYFSYTKP